MKKELEPINDIYNIDNMEYFMDDPKCTNCGKDAIQRCSRCKSDGIVLGNVKLKDGRFIKNYVKHLETLFKEEEGFNKQKKEFNMIKTKSDNNYDKENKNENNDEKKNNKVFVEEIKPKIEEKKEEKKKTLKLKKRKKKLMNLKVMI